jgi:hypothetical protein
LIQFSKYNSNTYTFYPKIVARLSNILIRDPGSGIRDLGSGIRDLGSGIRQKPILDPESRGQKRNWIPVPDPQHWCISYNEASRGLLLLDKPFIERLVENPNWISLLPFSF